MVYPAKIAQNEQKKESTFMHVKYRAEFILVFTTLLAGAGWVFSKEAIQGLPPFGFIGLRFIFASLILLPFCMRALKAASLGDCLRAMSVGCFLGSAIFCWIHAISISDTLGEGAFIMSLSMLFVPIVAWVLFKTKPIRAFWLSLPIAAAGLFLLSWKGSWQTDPSQLWFLASAVGLALHFNFNSKYSAQLSPMLLTTLQLFSTGCIGIVLSLSVETWPEHISLITWKWFALSVLLATSLRYLMQTTGQKLANPTNAALLMLLEPVWTLILSVLIYSEPMPINKVFGCLLLLASLVFYRLSSIVSIRKTKRLNP
jgi:drug/metabolite transporter (DMT)-like permease